MNTQLETVATAVVRQVRERWTLRHLAPRVSRTTFRPVREGVRLRAV